ncbi:MULTISPECIES: MarR family winged helix-turn-helix transcriptional regulator [Clostridium]|uniref:Transcriptional regulator n=1 Tax=Clostridium saccharoperbutylacetonicum N1-4(HMT) TaxID=931276 RepID=M1MSI4_9CLOT|nr:MarR family winged helix-turn-helix transcriptional regulator [Clostridium saccharoperbutylacetonicum]AGF57676.1 transcriptional regulator [Clostridium saccharoperbutylacetonicum N1-4(HMT)]AQR96371.1 transcriptional regulator SlyA [Clostridium saccharoperbutylacetonicum]NRT61556.1 DNA-binding MarR family transcriptional regulator [Clostridium saccharoperbutylacetonicum]NSB24879.1 DNA-binding MarR family transcriptional regulator [Clostridium saccharoperbutylacetonicum]NSB32244.1 DNA-binding
MEKESIHFIALNSKIFRNTQIFLDKVLKNYNLSSGSLPYIFNLEKNEGITQNKLSKEIGNDKAMSARTITKLIELEFVYKKQDEKDGRAYNLYLTEKAKELIPKIRKDIRAVVDIVTEDLTEEEKFTTTESLKKILDRTQKLREEV